MFRHTVFHRRLKRDFFERRDLMSVITGILCSAASLSACGRIDASKALDVVEEKRESLMTVAFPYSKRSEDENGGDADKEDYDKLFDELDDIIKSDKGEPS